MIAAMRWPARVQGQVGSAGHRGNAADTASPRSHSTGPIHLLLEFNGDQR
jgi:hypothetical protein